MLSKLTIFYLALCTNMMWYGGAIPFWLEKSSCRQTYTIKRLNISSKSHRVWKIFHLARNMLDTAYFLLVSYRLASVEISGADTENLTLIVKLIYVTLSYGGLCMYDIETALKGFDTIPYLISQYMWFFRDIERKYICRVTPHKRSKMLCETDPSKFVKCNILPTTFLVVGSFISLQNFIIMMRKPESLHFFTSLLENPKEAGVITKLPLILMQVIIWYNLWSGIFFYVFTVYIYCCCGVYLRRELK